MLQETGDNLREMNENGLVDLTDDQIDEVPLKIELLLLLHSGQFTILLAKEECHFFRM